MGEHVAPTTPAKKKRSNIFWNIVGVVGELLITFAIIVGLFSVWQLYWTTYEVAGQVSQTIASYEEEHQPSKRALGEVRTDDPPAFDREVGDGEVYGLVHVPTWDWMKIPLAEGTTSYVLDQGWAGHYDMTTQPGGVGNFSIAGHRRTYGNNFRWIDRLTQGDKVVVEVDDHYLVYSMVSSEIIDASDPTQMRVVAPVIDDVSWSETPTERWMTMTTCHPEYGNWQRYIVHLKFESWTPKDTGVPAELVDEPTN